MKARSELTTTALFTSSAIQQQ